MTTEAGRLHLAWLLWCYSEGYDKAEDRAVLSNWLSDPDDLLTQEDQDTRDALLVMADEILAELARMVA